MHVPLFALSSEIKPTQYAEGSDAGELRHMQGFLGGGSCK